MRITSNPSNLISSSYILALNHRKMKIVDNWWESGSESSTYWSWAVLCKKKNFSHPVPSLPLSSSPFPSLSIFSLSLLYPSFTPSHPFLLFPLSPFVFRPFVSSLFVPFPSLLCPSLLRFHFLFPSLRLRVLSCSLLPPLIFSPLSLSPGLGALKASPAGTGWSILSIMTPGENRFSSFWCWCLGGLEPSPTDRPGGDHSRIDPLYPPLMARRHGSKRALCRQYLWNRQHRTPLTLSHAKYFHDLSYIFTICPSVWPHSWSVDNTYTRELINWPEAHLSLSTAKTKKK